MDDERVVAASGDALDGIEDDRVRVHEPGEISRPGGCCPPAHPDPDARLLR
jgi:hypothetical protein